MVDMKVPKEGSERYKEILRIGCGGHYDEWNGDYDCDHGYTWSCDDCPIVLEIMKNDNSERCGEVDSGIIFKDS